MSIKKIEFNSTASVIELAQQDYDPVDLYVNTNESEMALIGVIPDIHGDIKALVDSMADMLQFASSIETSISKWIFLGDYIDRGEESFEVIQKINSIKESSEIITIFGNHEALMLNALLQRTESTFIMWIFNNGLITLKSLVLNICPEYIELVEDLKQILPNGYKKAYSEAAVVYYVENKDKFDNVFDKILDNSEIKKFFGDLKLCHVHDNTMFVHGGIDRRFIEDLNLYQDSDVSVSDWPVRINQKFQEAIDLALKGEFKLFEVFHQASSSSGGNQNAGPFWFRLKDFKKMDYLEILITEDYYAGAGIQRVMVGHSIVEEVTKFSFPGGLNVWFGDLGMSEAYDTYYEKAGILIPNQLGLTKSGVFSKESYYFDSFGYLCSLSLRDK